MIQPIIAIVQRSLIKLKRDRMKLFSNLFMSGLLLFIFSFVMKSSVPGITRPMNYLISGIIIMTVFQSSLTNSIHILEDIASGFMKEILVAPIARWQIAIGHVLSAMTISVIQGIIVVGIGLFMGLNINFLHGIEMIGLMFLTGLTFSSIGLYLASVTKDSGNFQLLVMILMMPLTFLSGAFIPTIAMPKILMPIVYINPLTYTTAAFRYVVLNMGSMTTDALVKAGVAFNIHGFIISPILSLLMIFMICVIFFSLSVKRFSSADFSRVRIFKRQH